MATFTDALAFTLTWEGDLIDHPSDPGGLTKYGISQKAYPDLNVRALTVSEAGAIYRRDYWDAMRCDELPAGLAFTLFDFAVNAGVSRAAKALQEIVRTAADGKIGSLTVAAIRARRESYLIENILQARAEHYVTLVMKSKLYLPFIKGWARRLIACAVKAGALSDG